MSEQELPNELRTKTEVYSRVVGYLRPVNQWNEGKQEEFKDRRLIKKGIPERMYTAGMQINKH